MLATLTTSRRLNTSLHCLLLVSVLCCHVEAQEKRKSGPATVKEAIAVLDMQTLPLADKTENPVQRTATQLNYEATGSVKSAFELHQKQLTAAGWKVLPGETISDQYATATFRKDGFTLALMALPASRPNSAMITLINHGNVELKELPLPSGSQQVFSGPSNFMVLAPGSVEETRTQLHTRLLKAGWKSFGSAGDQQFYIQNGVRLNAMISSAPAQAGKTMITYSTEQLSAELPFPENAENLQYSDVTHQLSFELPGSLEDVDQFYRAALAPLGWRATLDKPSKEGFKYFVIYRDRDMNLIQTEFRDLKGKQRVEVKWQSKAEVDELERRAREAIEKRKKEQSGQ